MTWPSARRDGDPRTHRHSTPRGYQRQQQSPSSVGLQALGGPTRALPALATSYGQGGSPKRETSKVRRVNRASHHGPETSVFQGGGANLVTGSLWGWHVGVGGERLAPGAGEAGPYPAPGLRRVFSSPAVCEGECGEQSGAGVGDGAQGCPGTVRWTKTGSAVLLWSFINSLAANRTVGLGTARSCFSPAPGVGTHMNLLMLP